ncbi:MAG: ATPase domain-containing protein [Alphaproteobacteria bacterium]
MEIPSLARTGIDGLDEVLRGGLPPGRIYMVQGSPGSGKTTLGLHFLLEGRNAGEPVLFISLSETLEELESGARSHGWTLDGIEVQVHALTDRRREEQTVFLAAQVELPELMQEIMAGVESAAPSRVVIDSLSEFRLLAGTAHRYRREMIGLKQFFSSRGCTVLLLDDQSLSGPDGSFELQSLAHGVVELDEIAPDFGPARRRLRVRKIRGVPMRTGWHDYMIATGGLAVFPRLIAAEFRRPFVNGTASTGSPELDGMLGNGIDRGSGTLLIGPAGVGKSSIATLCTHAAAQRGERVAVYLFDERLPTFFKRASGLGLDLEPFVDSGLVTIQQIDPAERTPGQFARDVKDEIECRGARVIVIDSLTGYLNSMSQERNLVLQLHELLSYTGQLGVVSLLVFSQHGLFTPMPAPVDVSYLADNIVLLRHYEYGAELRQTLSVFKCRSGPHDRSLRKFVLGPGGIHIGPPLKELRGVLGGIPELMGHGGGIVATRAPA